MTAGFANSMMSGTAQSVSETDSMEVEVEVPPFSKVAVSIKATKSKKKIKFTATQCTRFVDGTKTCETIEGYKFEISTDSAVVDYGRFQPLKVGEGDNDEPAFVSQNDPLANANSLTEGADILFRKKFKDTNIEVWKSHDVNKNAHEVSFFRPSVNLKSKECALGDMVVRGSAFPNWGHLLVAQRKDGALSHPTKFEKVFNTNGLNIFKMVPESDDYKCIGYVARKNGEDPIKEAYCCVRISCQKVLLTQRRQTLENRTF